MTRETYPVKQSALNIFRKTTEKKIFCDVGWTKKRQKDIDALTRESYRRAEIDTKEDEKEGEFAQALLYFTKSNFQPLRL